MRITVLCSDPDHPVNEPLGRWCGRQGRAHQIERVEHTAELSGGDVLFLVSCSELVSARRRAAYAHVLVLHASDLPRGRGWSPHVWQILEGADRFVVSLLEAEDAVDSGAIWAQETVEVPGSALAAEVDALLFAAELRLMDRAVDAIATGNVDATPQDPAIAPSYFRKRTPEDSRLDPERTIAEQFDLLRICDPRRYPAFIEHRGRRYRLYLEADDD